MISNELLSIANWPLIFHEFNAFVIFQLVYILTSLISSIMLVKRP